MAKKSRRQRQQGHRSGSSEHERAISLPGVSARAQENGASGSKSAQDGIAGSGVQLPATKAEESLARRARAREVAIRVDPRVRRARIRAIQEIAGIGAYERGETSRELAELWGLATNTVEDDACTAFFVMQETADQGVDRAVFWREVYDQLERAKDILEVTTELVRRTDVPMKIDQMTGEVVGPDWMGIKGMADAMGRAHDNVSKAVETIGKAGGFIQSGKQTSVSVRVDLGDGKTAEAPIGQVTLENENTFAWLRAEHPELVDDYMARAVRPAAKGEKYSLTVKEGA